MGCLLHACYCADAWDRTMNKGQSCLQGLQCRGQPISPVPGDPHPSTDQVSEIKHFQVGLSKSQFRGKESWGPERLDELVKPSSQPGREGEVNQLRFIVHQLCAMPCQQSAIDYIWFNAKWPWGQLISRFRETEGQKESNHAQGWHIMRDRAWMFSQNKS